jgi:hypothetical protein
MDRAIKALDVLQANYKIKAIVEAWNPTETFNIPLINRRLSRR